jgi:hypothetical protein
MAEHDDNKENPGCAGTAGTPGTVSQCGNSGPGAKKGAGQDGNREPERECRHVKEDPEGRPAPQPAVRPEPEPFVQEKVRKTGLHDTPPVPAPGDRMIRKNSLKYPAGQAGCIHDRPGTAEYRQARAVARPGRRIDEPEEWWRQS